MNNQQGPFNSPFSPKMGNRSGDAGKTENTRTTGPNARLGRKTNLRGVGKGNLADQHTEPPMTNPDYNGQQAFPSAQQPPAGGNGPQAFLPPQQSWGGSTASQSDQAAQKPWNETATQAFQSGTNFKSPANTNTSFGQTDQTPRTPTGKLGPNSSLLGNPMFPKSNNGQSVAGTHNLGDAYGMAPDPNAQPTNSGMYKNPTGALGNSGMYKNPTGALGNSGMYKNPTGALGNSGMYTNQTGTLSNGNTGALMHPAGEYSGDTGMLKLNQAVKVVRIPVAGKPGEFKTGILPVISQNPTGALPPPPPIDTSFQGKVKNNSKKLTIVTLIILVIFSSGIYLFTHTGGNPQVTGTPPGKNTSASQAKINATATANVQATATFNNSKIMDDALSSNIHNWLVTAKGSDFENKGIRAFFQNNAYHISSKKTKDFPYFASSVQRNVIPPAKYSLSVDIQQVKGDENNAYNFYGLLFSYTEVGNHPVTYAFRIVNNKDDRRYDFNSLDGRRPGSGWLDDPMWEHKTGKEFHGGKQAVNNLKVQVDGHKFTFFVNGVKLGTKEDTKYGSGGVGMGVNGLTGADGSEVVFTNFLLTSN
ncbi:hypothetical protein KDA_11830 [Dictyobacter alpinus]|uniref:3-keto-disaccharide hydrolase domain-containing protein n=1 Tax=Dictyobacter alpinus TaxID=2014873 RepID=A0A402B2X7_9CHLR|nr:hypothetical protein [Dictyobacter alpinus]GCE25699.1 hypothetical protein KDA_11830 [Dictyobacter alpinus]